MRAHRLGKFVLDRRRSGTYVVTLHSSNGKTLALTETYETKRAALAAVDAIRRVAADARFEDRSDVAPAKRPAKRTPKHQATSVDPTPSAPSRASRTTAPRTKATASVEPTNTKTPNAKQPKTGTSNTKARKVETRAAQPAKRTPSSTTRSGRGR